MKINNKVTLSTGKLKGCAMGALEYAISNIINQYETKYNVKIKSIARSETGIKVDWEETASGIRTEDEVNEIHQQRLNSMVQSLTEKMAEYEQQRILRNS